MCNGKAVLVGVVTVSTLLISGCESWSTPAEPMASIDLRGVGAPASVLSSGQRHLRTLDEEFAWLAAEVVPGGFGGLFFDENQNLTIYLTDTSQRGAAVAALIPYLTARDLRLRGGRRVDLNNMRVLSGRYDFFQLNQWKDQLSAVFEIPAVTAVDVLEQENRLEVAVDDLAARPGVERKLAELGIPLEAVTVVRESLPPPTKFLFEEQRPLQGGWMAGTNQRCTLGPLADSGPGTTRRVLVASHCTYQLGLKTFDLFFQPYGGGFAFGEEDEDAGFWWGYPCPSGKYCRSSDAALVRIFDGVLWDFGYIARTRFPGTAEGSYEVDPYNPTFRITSWMGQPFWNQTLDKIGQRTGWTWGQVDKTCVNYPYAYDVTKVFLCQFRVIGGGAAAGDSGAPVFAVLGGDSIRLAGILWAGKSTAAQADSTYFVFSPMTGIEDDLGALRYHP
jgi:hypothetical protein